MAETLGSLIDKLTIKELREYHLKAMLKSRVKSFPVPDLKKKLRLTQLQKKDLIEEINDFIVAVVKGKVKMSDEKLKIYNAPQHFGRIPELNSPGQAISYLAQKNLELWGLEDEARRKDVSNAYIGKIKSKINLANQQRNDLIDALDKLLEKCIKNVSSS